MDKKIGKKQQMFKRGAGVLLHISSLPSLYGIGDFGPEAFAFVDFLKKSKQHYWQILPLNPTDPICGNSPYSSHSAFAMNVLFISPDVLVKKGWLTAEEVKAAGDFSKETVDYEGVIADKGALLEKAFARFYPKAGSQADFQKFCKAQEVWLADYALLLVLKEKFQGQMWSDWPEEFRRRQPGALEAIQGASEEKITKIKFYQFLAYEQWMALKQYGRQNGVAIIGDIPIYVSYDSADVWAHPDIFKLDEKGRLVFVAGVPPDYFSATGQRWGNPVFDWEALQKKDYAWWFERIKHVLSLFDIVRIDHFRGFVDFWQIPAEEPTAVHGQWLDGPGEDFFKKMLRKFPQLPIIAEDLGILTPRVTEAINRFHFPGMKVLLFAFGGEMDKNPYLPEKYRPNCIVYTGTHDNNTAKGWLEHDAATQEKENLETYFKKKIKPDQIAWVLIRLAFQSKASLAIIPVQDLLGLGRDARMNTPATTHGNWQWRLIKDKITTALSEKLRQLTQASQRA